MKARTTESISRTREERVWGFKEGRHTMEDWQIQAWASMDAPDFLPKGSTSAAVETPYQVVSIPRPVI